MDSRFTPYGKTLIDPIFIIPDGAEDEFVYSRTDADDIQVDIYEGQAFAGLDAPNNFRVVEQKLRRRQDGTIVVDVIIEVEEVVGAIKYEIQAAKTTQNDNWENA